MFQLQGEKLMKSIKRTSILQIQK